MECEFIPTLNQMGYQLTKLDIYSRKFICAASKSNQPNLDIGCAYGLVALEIIANGGMIDVNDLDARHLNGLKNKVPKNKEKKITRSEGAHV